METYYHVADAGYGLGEDLLCWDEQVRRGWDPPTWKWEPDQMGMDADVVCLFEHLEEAVEFQADFGGRILRVEFPEGAEEAGVTIVRNSEGFPVAMGRIPGEYVSAQS